MFDRYPMRINAHPEPFIKKEPSEYSSFYECNAMLFEHRNIKLTIIL